MSAPVNQGGGTPPAQGTGLSAGGSGPSAPAPSGVGSGGSSLSSGSTPTSGSDWYVSDSSGISASGG